MTNGKRISLCFSKWMLNYIMWLIITTLEVGGTLAWKLKWNLDVESEQLWSAQLLNTSVVYLIIYENAGQALREKRAGSTNTTAYSLPTCLWFVRFFFFSRNLVSDKQDSLAQCADFRNNLPSQEAMLCSGPLAVIQGRTSKYALNCFIWSACLSFFPITYSCVCISELVLEMLIVPKVILSS